MPFVNLSKTEYQVMLVHKMRKQFEGYTNQDVNRTKLGRELQAMVVHPSERE